MTTNPWQILMCRFGRHRRSRSRAHDDGVRLRSVCRYCGVPMIRNDRTWTAIEDEADDLPPGA